MTRKETKADRDFTQGWSDYCDGLQPQQPNNKHYMDGYYFEDFADRVVYT